MVCCRPFNFISTIYIPFGSPCILIWLSENRTSIFCPTTLVILTASTDESDLIFKIPLVGFGYTWMGFTARPMSEVASAEKSFIHLTDSPCPLGPPEAGVTIEDPTYKYLPPEFAVSELQKYPRCPTKVKAPVVLLLYPPAGSFRELAYAVAGLLIPSAPTKVTHSADVGSLQPWPTALHGSAPFTDVTEDEESAFHPSLVAFVAHQEELLEPTTKALVPDKPSGEFAEGAAIVAEFLS